MDVGLGSRELHRFRTLSSALAFTEKLLCEPHLQQKTATILTDTQGRLSGSRTCAFIANICVTHNGNRKTNTFFTILGMVTQSAQGHV